MKALTKEKVVIVGCGNVAWHIAKHLVSLNKFEVIIYNHQTNPALLKFRNTLKCKTHVGLKKIIADAPWYFICVDDKNISSVASAITPSLPNAIVLHTSGSMQLNELGNRIHPTGVFYPLQTFSKQLDVNWAAVPIIIEANDKKSEKEIRSFAGLFSKKILSYTYKQRLKLHVSAVVVNNFVNALYVFASEFARQGKKDEQFDFKVLIPLIETTTNKVKLLDPLLAQTGPAKRNDEAVMKKHLKVLKKNSDLHKIYKQLSQLIVSQQRK